MNRSDSNESAEAENPLRGFLRDESAFIVVSDSPSQKDERRDSMYLKFELPDEQKQSRIDKTVRLLKSEVDSQCEKACK